MAIYNGEGTIYEPLVILEEAKKHPEQQIKEVDENLKESFAQFTQYGDHYATSWPLENGDYSSSVKPY